MKTLLITGGARGIGKGISEYFLNKGWNVCVNYFKSEPEALKLKEKYPNCFPVKADVSSESDVKNMISTVIGKFGFVDCVINNAGVAKTELLQYTSSEDYDRIFNTNVKGMFLTVKEILPCMINEKRGSIINISSMWGVTGGAMEVVYSASKAAVIGFTKALAKEVGPSGIRVNAIAPGVIKTDMLSNLNEDDLSALKDETPLGRTGTPVDIAKTAWFLASDDADFITGQVIGVNGGMVI